MVGDFSRSGKVPPDHDLDQDLPGTSVESPSRKNLFSQQKDPSRGIREGAGSGKEEPGKSPGDQGDELPVEKEPSVTASRDESGGDDEIHPFSRLDQHPGKD